MSETPKLTMSHRHNIFFCIAMLFRLTASFFTLLLGDPKYHGVGFITWMVGMMAAVCDMLENICNQQCGYSKRVVVWVGGWAGP